MIPDNDEVPRVVHLFLKPGHRLPMQAVTHVHAVARMGLEGDASFGRSRRQILLISQKHLADLDLQPGDVRENVTLSEPALDGLQPGDHLELGDAILQVTGDCQPCDRMDELRPGLQEHLRGRRGILARVVTGGDIRIGDALRPSHHAPHDTVGQGNRTPRHLRQPMARKQA